MSKGFVHLHTHTHYSLLQGLTQTKDLVARAQELGMTALAITDYGSLYGAIDFYKRCREVAIKPIIGVEAYMAARGMEDKEHGIDNKRTLFTLLAETDEGYQNLMKAVSQSYLKGFYYKPRMDKDLLRTYAKGLICLSGPVYSELGQAVHTKNFARAKDIIAEYKDIFGDNNYFIEIMRNDHIEGLDSVNKDLVTLARETNTPIVATQNSHYLHPEDREAFDVLLTVGMVGVKKATGDFMKGTFHFTSGEEMQELFADLPEALENTQKVADRCNVEIDLTNWRFPEYPIPEGKTYDQVLREQTYAGIEKKELDPNDAKLKERIEYELDIIKMKGYASYFLIVADLLNFCREKGIYTNTRGSAAGSIVSYLNFITNVDPIKLRLPFERFLNPERPSLPDIDMDFADTRRDEVIDYAREKYGQKAVAQIGTFGTMLARGSVRDTARALGYDYEKGDAIAKLIPMPKQGFPIDINKALDMEPDLAKMYKTDKDVKKILDMAKKIEGCARHISVHAAGVVISPTRVDDYSPVQWDPKGEGKIITQYDMYTGNREGVVTLPKFDFLGIRNLAILGDAIDLVKTIHNIDIDIETVPHDDKKTYAMLTEGRTMGVFQLAGDGMTHFLKDLRPTELEDLIAMVALYRPGPMQFIPDFIKRKENPRLVTYLDSRLEPILKSTYGIIVYQEQIMEIASILAGYTMGEGDKFRKAVGKKIPEEMAKQHGRFVSGCVEGGMTEKKAEELWTTIETFAAYGFNKAHAASYGQVSYWTAYMKANYPVPYMTALLSAESGKTEKIAEIIAECTKMNIDVLPPDVNESFGSFTVVETSRHAGQTNRHPELDSGSHYSSGFGPKDSKMLNQVQHDSQVILDANKEIQGDTTNGKIRFGLYTIKNFGHDIADAIIAERKAHGAFKDMEDFLERINHKNLNKKSLEALIMSGAMDAFGERGSFLENMNTLLTFSKASAESHQDQGNLFGDLADAPKAQLHLNTVDPVSVEQKLAWERELLGVYVSGHPLEKYQERLERAQFDIKKVFNDIRQGVTVVVAGIVDESKEIVTKNGGKKMAFIKVTDLSGTLECVVFPKVYDTYRDLVQTDQLIMIKGQVSDRGGERSLMVEAIKPLSNGEK